MQPIACVPSNRLLQAMSAETRSRIVPHLERVALPLGTVVSESGVAAAHMYFPIDCIISLLNATEDRHSEEISMVGNEGMLGLSLFMGGATTATSAVVQNAGSAYRLPSAMMESEFLRHGEFMALMLRFTQSLITQIAQTAACNRHHTIYQQVCRWLLHSLDRLPSNRLLMTQGLIANLLGVRREGVTEAAVKLQAQGAITYQRGCIDVIDRELLERQCCECHGVVKREYERLMPHFDGAPERTPARIGFAVPDVQRPRLATAYRR